MAISSMSQSVFFPFIKRNIWALLQIFPTGSRLNQILWSRDWHEISSNSFLRFPRNDGAENNSPVSEKLDCLFANICVWYFGLKTTRGSHDCDWSMPSRDAIETSCWVMRLVRRNEKLHVSLIGFSLNLQDYVLRPLRFIRSEFSFHLNSKLPCPHM